MLQHNTPMTQKNKLKQPSKQVVSPQECQSHSQRVTHCGSPTVPCGALWHSTWSQLRGKQWPHPWTWTWDAWSWGSHRNQCHLAIFISARPLQLIHQPAQVQPESITTRILLLQSSPPFPTRIAAWCCFHIGLCASGWSSCGRTPGGSPVTSAPR